MAEPAPVKILINNKKARHDYNILECYEAGIVLAGSEVKSLKDKKGAITDSFVLIEQGEAFLHNLYITPYEHCKSFKLDSKRKRKLLLHHKEIRKLIGAIKKKGQTVVPIKIYQNRKNLIKVEIALVSGRKKHDKREYEKQKEWRREKVNILKSSDN